MRLKLASVLGWYGVLAILAAYALLSFGAIGPRSGAYQLLNLTGALGIVVETWTRKDYQPFVLNLVWLAVAATALLRTL